MLVECSLVVATCGDMSEADADFSAVELLYEERASSRALDAVTIGKKMSGEARLVGAANSVVRPVTKKPWAAAWPLAWPLFCIHQWALTCRQRAWPTSRS